MRQIFEPRSDGTKSLSVPSSLAFLTGIGLSDAKLVLSSSDGGFKLSEMSARVVSSASLELWAAVKLKNLKLYFKYSNVHGNEDKSISLGATFSISQTNLDFTIAYDGPGSKLMASQTPPDTESAAVTVSQSGAWKATATYDGTISVFDIMSGIADVDRGKELTSIGLSALREVIDFKMSDLKLTLTRKSNETSFAFAAHVKYLFFDGPVRLMCSYSTSWIYWFVFTLSSADFLSSLGIQGISLTKSSVIVLSNTTVRGSPLVSAVTSSGLNLAFSGRLVFTGSLQGLAKVTGNRSLIISGSVSDSAFSLAAAVSQIPVFNGMILTGNLFLSYSTSSKQLVAAVQGTVFYFGRYRKRHNCLTGLVSKISFSQISSEKFSTTFSLFVKLPDPELGFQFTVNKLTNAFGIEGLHFKDILFRAAFQEFPVPSEVAIAGRLWLHVGDQQFFGRYVCRYLC